MKSNNFGFEKARGLVKGCLYAAIAFCGIGLLVNNHSADLAMYACIAAVVLMFLGLFITFTCMKCPYCNERIIVKCLTAKVCPHCKRNLETGMKAKGKAKRR